MDAILIETLEKSAYIELGLMINFKNCFPPLIKKIKYQTLMERLKSFDSLLSDVYLLVALPQKSSLLISLLSLFR